MAHTTETADPSDITDLVPATGREVVIAHIQSLIDELPQASEGDELAIVEQLLSAGTVEQLDRPWDSDSLEQYLGRRITILSARWRQSDYADGLGIYLILELVDEGTGEAAIAMTGSTSIVAQILQANHLVGLPISCVPVRAKHASARGYFPQHLEKIRRV